MVALVAPEERHAFATGVVKLARVIAAKGLADIGDTVRCGLEKWYIGMVCSMFFQDVGQQCADHPGAPIASN